MARFDRYLVAQFLSVFGFFSLVLVLVYWVNRAIVLFDRLIADGHSAGVFLELTALTLPNVIRLVLPISAFAAALYATNRLQSDSELVVMQATGFSPWRLARAVAAFGAVAGLAVLALAHVAVPASLRILADRTAALAEDVTSGLLTDGTFLHPGEGVTLYVARIGPDGALRDIFLSDARDSGERRTYTAREAMLAQGEDGPQLVMSDGMVQVLGQRSGGASGERGESVDDATGGSAATGNRGDGTARLSVTRFDDFAFDIAAALGMPGSRAPRLTEIDTADLMRADPALQAATGQDRAALVFEAHQRFAQGATATAVPVMGFAAMLLGGWSRLGSWRQIGIAVVALIAVELARNAVAAPARADPAMVWLAYAPPAMAAGFAVAFLWLAARPRRRPAVPA